MLEVKWEYFCEEGQQTKYKTFCNSKNVRNAKNIRTVLGLASLAKETEHFNALFLVRVGGLCAEMRKDLLFIFLCAIDPQCHVLRETPGPVVNINKHSTEGGSLTVRRVAVRHHQAAMALAPR